MKITVHTKLGSYSSKHMVATKNEAEEMEKLLRSVAKSADNSYLSLDTDTGYIVFGGSLLNAAVFVVDV